MNVHDNPNKNPALTCALVCAFRYKRAYIKRSAVPSHRHNIPMEGIAPTPK